MPDIHNSVPCVWAFPQSDHLLLTLGAELRAVVVLCAPRVSITEADLATIARMRRRELSLQAAIFRGQGGCLLKVVHSEEVSCRLVPVAAATI